MNRIVAGAVVCLGVVGLVRPGAGRDDEAAKELKRLEGVWASTPAKKGRDRVHYLAFQGGRMAWKSFQTMDGEPVIGHTKVYDITLDPKASPKQITARRVDEDEVRRGVYELDGDTLKIAFSSGLDGERPKKLDGEDAPVITLARDKKAKVPDLSKARKRGKLVEVAAKTLWTGSGRDPAVAKKCPEKPITTAADFETVWKALRGDEAVPKVDFAKEFVLVHTSAGVKVTKVGLYYFEGDDEAGLDTAFEATAGKKGEGFGYALGVFDRGVVDVVDGKFVVRPQKK